MGGAPCDVIKLQIQEDEQDKVEAALFKALGCTSAVASSHPLCVGKTEELALTFKTTDAPKELGWWRTQSRPV